MIPLIPLSLNRANFQAALWELLQGPKFGKSEEKRISAAERFFAGSKARRVQNGQSTER